MSLMRRSRSGTTVCGLTGIIAFGAAALAPCLREALAGCPETEPVYLGKNDQGDQCTASLRPQTSSGTPASFVLTARSSVDDSAPTDPDASGLPGTVSTSSTKGAGVKTASCSGSKGISGGGGT
ncbi:MAG: hypothetical protein ACE5HE_06870 [Phycisphaerae bacterium]